MTELRLILAAVESPPPDAWERFCGDVPFVTVHRGSILDLKPDAVVRLANSFGFMDGGIDAVYLDYFWPEIQERPCRQIFDHTRASCASGVLGSSDRVWVDSTVTPSESRAFATLEEVGSKPGAARAWMGASENATRCKMSMRWSRG